MHAVSTPSTEAKDIADRHPDFELLFRQFTSTVEALVEVIDAITPHVAELDPNTFQIQLPKPPEGKQDSLVKAVRDFAASSAKPKDDGGDQENGEETAARNERSPVVKFSADLAEIYGDNPPTLQDVNRAFQSAAERPRRDQLLHGSLLTMAIGALEAAIAGISTQHFVLHPGALASSEKEFSLADLAGFEDIQDARDLAIARRVDDLMRGSFDDWDSWLQPLLKVDFHELAASYSTLLEAIQRRHIIVHNAGRVSRRYLSKVPDSDRSLGKKLRVDQEYLEKAVQEVSIFGARLLLVAWSRWRKDESEEAAAEANDFAFRELSAGRPKVAQCITQTAGKIARKTELKWYLQINEWQAIKQMSGQDAIRTPVEEWDISALSPLYAAAQAALLDNFERLFELIPGLLERKELRREALETWPLFSGAREQDGWKDVEQLFPEQADESSRSEEG
jgi:hypothetical protein